MGSCRVHKHAGIPTHQGSACDPFRIFTATTRRGSDSPDGLAPAICCGMQESWASSAWLHCTRDLHQHPHERLPRACMMLLISRVHTEVCIGPQQTHQTAASCMWAALDFIIPTTLARSCADWPGRPWRTLVASSIWCKRPGPLLSTLVPGGCHSALGNIHIHRTLGRAAQHTPLLCFFFKLQAPVRQGHGAAEDVAPCGVGPGIQGHSDVLGLVHAGLDLHLDCQELLL